MPSGGYNIVLFLGREEAAPLERALRPFPVHYCLSVCKQREFMPPLSCADHEWRHPDRFDDIDWNIMTPLGEDIIEKMRACEGRVLQMYERLEGKGHTLSYQERKHLYLQQLRFCHHIITRKSIDLFLLTNVPHHGMSFLLYSLCKEQGIPVLFPYHIDPFLDLFHCQDNWENPVPELRKRYEERKRDGIDPLSLSLFPPLHEFWLAHTGEVVKKGKDTPDPTPWYMKGRATISAFDRWVKLVRALYRHNLLRFFWHSLTFLPRRLHPSYLMNRFRRAHALIRARAMYGFYDKHSKQPDLTARYVYVPLQLQPEATTLPMGGAYVNQPLVVQMLHAFLRGDNVLLYVKEHPRQQGCFPYGRGRSRAFYEDLLACDSVRFVPTTFDTVALTDHALAVATVTGTAGLEALVHEKPVLLFGHRYFQDAPGVFSIRTCEDCRQALRMILDEGQKPNLSDVRLFFKALEDTVLEGSIGVTRGTVSRFSPQENVQRVGDALSKEIEERYGWRRKEKQETRAADTIAA